MKGLRGGVSPYGPKGSLKNWTLAERLKLAEQIQEITLEICEAEGISWVQVYGTHRSRERDRVRLLVVQQVCKRTDAPPAIVARCFACDRQTIMSALRGGRGRKSMWVPMPNNQGPQ